MLVRWFDSSTDLFALHRRSPARCPFLLDSAVTGTPHSRYSILLALPDERLRLTAEGALSGPHAPGQSRFVDALDSWFLAEAAAAAPVGDELPFHGGWFLYLGYELAAELEPTLDLPPATGIAPVAEAVRCRGAVIVDHERRACAVVAEPGEQAGFAALCEDVASGMAARGTGAAGPIPAIAAIREDESATYLDGVRRCLDYIRDGDVFQVNLSRGWEVTLSQAVPHADLYARLREANPAPFAGLADFGDWALLSSSPERLVKVRGRRVDTRPIAGTRPRGADGGEDERLSRELIGHPKERAEHVMLLDLERNDLGRICRPGSIRVDELMSVESYRHVHHIVSNVTGELRQGVPPGEVIRAVFPGGTITGCPKVRCMEIIAELEGVGRGAYTGAIGYLDRSGDMDLNILIRSILRQGDTLRFRTGAGIVADSDPQAELEETRHKARGLLRALGQGG
ncbi:MAG: aminodeoxychorismate synthase component I [Gammaproteobacteria bacterium]|nr:aminodeoxychorismate synthase component I [Gammaproteobacteria bacterium]MDX5374300.1 aminodeoxychorismate synthase component I [Gammaproteobacteria bacterium]